MPESPARVVADPAPLGLAAFGCTTLMLSLFNAGIRPALIAALIPTAFLLGGVVQLVAGIFELKQGATFVLDVVRRLRPLSSATSEPLCTADVTLNAI
ncbi:acetate uptake transporter [Actinacidiphila rubida]|uniref:Uncharacterized protein n=1 Tax=Actinacidiphila rubida TaxID=310780 RepID=A0A1H8MXG5_9ACTN|nr:GPR1/FUN34/YaaH family transporter [Actinacidiphila rubida]SEO21970.1 hypothetical protein SAMN05216267_102061 [Actinacidiphila rubida]